MALRRARSHRARNAAASSFTVSDLGSKVSILYRIEDDTYPYSEAVGVLSRIESDPEVIYVVIRRDGSQARVPEAAIITSKVVPTRKPG
ncbi:MAG TPA: hypothetical protein VI541_04305 [Actinomycetota bacterium]|nr:hypothetical protein [Actinomycetota bacterium]